MFRLLNKQMDIDFDLRKGLRGTTTALNMDDDDDFVKEHMSPRE
jgi:hypothetical protein